MRYSNASGYVPLVQAMAEGRIVQQDLTGLGIWEDCEGGVDFDMPPHRYRVKPTAPPAATETFRIVARTPLYPNGYTWYTFTDLLKAKARMAGLKHGTGVALGVVVQLIRCQDTIIEEWTRVYDAH